MPMTVADNDIDGHKKSRARRPIELCQGGVCQKPALLLLLLLLFLLLHMLLLLL